MSGWLILWLSMAVWGPLGWLIVVNIDKFTTRPSLHDRRIRRTSLFGRGYEFDGLAVFLIVVVMLAVGAVGLLGTLGWLVAWGFG